MALVRTGNVTPEKRKDRVRLSVRDPLVESLVVGLGIEGETLEQIKAISKALVRERNRWDISRRKGGLFAGRLSKADADRALKRELADLAGGAE